MSLSPGTHIGPYEIESLAGSGGMGEVYRARDARLDRTVAIKALPEDVALDAERLVRFEREAKLLATLNHPNIAGIYGIEEADGKRFLVLEYVEGPTLAHRLAGGRLPTDEALDICRQIATALEAAHESGVIHRDLKPGNVKVTPAGEVKVLDFGLAKGAPGTAESASDLSHSPTITVNATGVGVILGTAAYMSPEQARGKPVDRRTDIWSFGCVLYECLTGDRLFAGETVSDTIAMILQRDPDWSVLPASTPEKVRELIRRCLEKDARKRLRDIGDARIELEEAEAAKVSAMRDASGAEAVAAARPSRALPIAWGVAAIAGIVAVLSLASSTMFRGTPSGSPARFVVQPPPGITMSWWTTGISISPDGRNITFVGVDSSGARFIYLRPLDTIEATPIPGTDNGGAQFWAPDGKSIGFFRGEKLRKLSIADGNMEVVCDARSSRGASWGKDFIVFAGEQGPIYKVPVAGGTPVAVTQLDTTSGQTAHRFPHFLPDGKTFLYCALPKRRGRVDIFAASVDGGSPKLVTSAAGTPVYSEPGYLLFQRGSNLVAQPFDWKRLEVSGEPGIIGAAPRQPPASGSPALSASWAGQLAYPTPANPNNEAVWLDMSGREVGRLPLAEGRYESPAFSPDRRYLAITRRDSPEESDIWLVEIERALATRFTFGPGRNTLPIWSPDGSRIAFASDRDGPWNLYVKEVAAGSKEEPLVVSDETFKNPMDWSPDGRYVVYEQIGTGTNMDIWIAPTDGAGVPEPFLRTTFQEEHGKLSPDGRWLVFSSNTTGTAEVYVTSFPEAGKRHRVSTGGGSAPFWTSSGREIIYNGPDGLSLMRVAVQTDPEFRAGRPRLAFRAPATISERLPDPDGRRLLALLSTSSNADFSTTVVMNWAGGLK